MTPTVSVVVPCHDATAWPRINRALDSVLDQRPSAPRVVVAVDHNPTLAERLRAQRPDVTVVENDTGSRGASGNRNAGAARCDTEIIAFLDDDEVAEPQWLARLIAPFDDLSVVGTGGRYRPAWLVRRPSWFPDELAWVVGGHHTGMPSQLAPVRNVWAGNLAVRRAAFDAVDGFRTDFGKVGARSRPEDTDLCIRVARTSGGRWLYVPDAVIDHDVPADRAAFGFFVRRCFAEGAGKVELREVLRDDGDTDTDALAVERDYLRRTIPRGVFGHLRHGRVRAAAAVVVGVLAAALGAASATLAGVRRAAP